MSSEFYCNHDSINVLFFSPDFSLMTIQSTLTFQSLLLFRRTSEQILIDDEICNRVIIVYFEPAILFQRPYIVFNVSLSNHNNPNTRN